MNEIRTGHLLELQPISQRVNELEIRIDPRQELMAIALTLSTYQERWHLLTELDSVYSQVIQQHFAPHKGHEIVHLLNDLLAAYQRGEPPWKLLFDKLGDFFDKRFGAEWQEQDSEFWSKFSRSYQIGKGIQERLKHDPKIIDKGI